MRNSHIINVGEQITGVEFCPYEWSSSLLAVGTTLRILIYQVKFPEDKLDVASIQEELIAQFDNVDCKTSSFISFSPQTTVAKLPKMIGLAVGYNTITYYKYYESSLRADGATSVVKINHHSEYLNDVALEPNSGKLIASVADDHKCCISNIDGTLETEFRLSSPPSSVDWHRSEEGKLLISERCGTILLYSIAKKRGINSFLDFHAIPLKSMKWCPLNSSRFGAVCYKKYFIWNLRGSSFPAEKGDLTHYAVKFRFSHINEDIFLTRSDDGREISVYLPRPSPPICYNLLTGRGISWHAKHHLFAADENSRVFLCKVDV